MDVSDKPHGWVHGAFIYGPSVLREIASKLDSSGAVSRLVHAARSPQPKTAPPFSLASGLHIWYKARRSYTLTSRSRSIMTVT
ncbi:MAG: hypothetical protein ACI9DO_002688 [Reinekea sp.]|jgi:hypothetical protein